MIQKHHLIKCIIVVIIILIILILYKLTLVVSESFSTSSDETVLKDDTRTYDNQILYRVKRYLDLTDTDKYPIENWIGFKNLSNVIYIQYLDSKKVLLIDKSHKLFMVHFNARFHKDKSYMQYIDTNNEEVIKVVSNSDHSKLYILTVLGNVYVKNKTTSSDKNIYTGSDTDTDTIASDIIDISYSNPIDKLGLITSGGKLQFFDTSSSAIYDINNDKYYINIVGLQSSCNTRNCIAFIGFYISDSQLKLFYIHRNNPTTVEEIIHPPGETLYITDIFEEMDDYKEFQMFLREKKDNTGDSTGYYDLFITLPQKNIVYIVEIAPFYPLFAINIVIKIQNVNKSGIFRDGHYVLTTTSNNNFYVYPHIENIKVFKEDRPVTNVGIADLNYQVKYDPANTAQQAKLTKFNIQNIVDTDSSNIQLFTGDTLNNFFIITNDNYL